MSFYTPCALANGDEELMERLRGYPSLADVTDEKLLTHIRVLRELEADVELLAKIRPTVFRMQPNVLKSRWSYLVRVWRASNNDISKRPSVLDVPVEEVRDLARALIVKDIQIKRLDWDKRVYILESFKDTDVYTNVDKVVPKEWRKGENPSEKQAAKLEWLEKLGVQNPLAVYKSQPDIFSDDIAVLNEKVRWLRQNGLQNIGVLISKDARILSLNEPRYVEYLKWFAEIGLQKTTILIMTQANHILKAELETLKQKRQDILDLGFSAEDYARMVDRSSRVMFMKSVQIKSAGDWLIRIGIENPLGLLAENPDLILPPQVLQKKYDWFNEIGFKDVTDFLKRNPETFALSLENNLQPTARHLQEVWGFRVEDLEVGARFLGASLERMSEVAAAMKKMGLNPKDQDLVFRKQIIVEVRREDLKPLLEKHQRGEKVTIYDVIGKRNPDLKLHPNYQETVEWLNSLGVDVSETLRLYPKILDADLSILRKRLQLLENLGTKNVIQIIRENPKILTVSETEFANKMNYLDQLGAHVSIIFEKHPRYFYANDDKIVERRDWLQTRGFADVGKLVERTPDILGWGVKEKLDPVWDLLTREWGATVQEVEAQSYLFGQSLKRMKQLKEAFKAANVNVTTLPWVRRAHILMNAKPEDVFNSLDRLLGGHKTPVAVDKTQVEKLIWLYEIGLDGDIVFREAPEIESIPLDVLQERFVDGVSQPQVISIIRSEDFNEYIPADEQYVCGKLW